MQLTHRAHKLLVTGRSGSGKTTFWVRYLLGTPAGLKFVFDHEGELSHRLGVPPAVNVDQLGQAAASGWCIYDPAAMFPGRLEEAFNFFCEFAFTVATRIPGRKIFACDELQKLVGTAKVSTELAMVLETGRRYGLDAAMISQQPNLIHNRIRNQVTEVVTFQQMDPNAVEYLEAVGFEPEQIRALRPGSFLARNLNSGAQSSGKVF